MARTREPCPALTRGAARTHPDRREKMHTFLGGKKGFLWGLPVLVKDLTDVEVGLALLTGVRRGPWVSRSG